MGTWLQGDVERASPGPFSRLLQRFDLRVGKARSLVPTLAYDPAFSIEHDATHHGVGRGCALCPAGPGSERPA